MKRPNSETSTHTALGKRDTRKGEQLRAVAFAGRIGTRDQVERLIRCHNEKPTEINLNKKPLVLLAWFGGTIKAFIDEKKNSISWLLDRYPELEPHKEVKEWYKDKRPNALAERLVLVLQRLIREGDHGS